MGFGEKAKKLFHTVAARHEPKTQKPVDEPKKKDLEPVKKPAVDEEPHEPWQSMRSGK